MHVELFEEVNLNLNLVVIFITTSLRTNFLTF